ncbi:hypothetical protein EQV77_00915 [Halobacillus fulvus]|nr:hypothetical protein EQV77_00915 [Halobacillus fulvus]
MQSPDIQLFNAIYKASMDLGYTTIDYSPVNDDSLDYPFVFVAETDNEDSINNKDVIIGNITQIVHVWGYATDRAAFSDMVHQLKQQMRRLSRLPNYRLKLENMNSNSMYDNTTTDNLLHGIIDVEYKLM